MELQLKCRKLEYRATLQSAVSIGVETIDTILIYLRILSSHANKTDVFWWIIVQLIRVNSISYWK